MPGGAWQDSCSTVESALSYMWRNEIVVDTEFKLDSGRSLYAHKLVLALWSPAFADCMTKKGSISKLEIDEDYEAMEFVLQYMYSSDVSNCLSKMSMDKLIKVLEIAERFTLVPLREKCMSSLQRRKIYSYNVLDFFDFSLRKNNRQIYQKCLKILKEKGIILKHVRESMSLVSILGILTQERIALSSEAQLLRMAINWLSYPKNARHKPEIISFIDLSCIEWSEYQDILKDFPGFFTESELASILMGVVLSDFQRFPEWYKSRITCITHSCESCTFVVKRMNFLEHLNLLQINDTAEATTKVAHTFRIVYDQEKLPRFVQIELGFGPNNIPKEDMTVTYRIRNSRSGTAKPCLLDSVRRQNTYHYVITLGETTKLRTESKLTLTFSFKKALRAYDIKVIQPADSERKVLRILDAAESISIRLISYKSLFLFAPEYKKPKFLVSTFNFRFCENHAEYLERKFLELKFLESPAKKIKTEHNYPVDINNIKKEEHSVITIDDSL